MVGASQQNPSGLEWSFALSILAAAFAGVAIFAAIMALVPDIPKTDRKGYPINHKITAAQWRKEFASGTPVSKTLGLGLPHGLGSTWTGNADRGALASQTLKPGGSKTVTWIEGDGTNYRVVLDSNVASALAAACYQEGLAVGRLQGEIENHAYMLSETTLTTRARKILSQGPSVGCGGK